MTDRKAFSEVLERLHQGRNRRIEDTATGSTAVYNKHKSKSRRASKENTSKSTRGQQKGAEECKSRAYANKERKTLDFGDLAQRYGELKLTKTNAVLAAPCDEACRAVSYDSIDPTKSSDALQSQVTD